MKLTIILALFMMLGLFLMLWGAVGFVQDKKLFSSAPKEGLAVIQPKKERFRGQHAVGWIMIIASIVLMAGAVLYGAYDGIQKNFSLMQFFCRFVTMLLFLKAYDIFFFDWFLLCRSGFFPHYYPELAPVYGPKMFGYNRKSHFVQIVCMILFSLLLAWICTLL